MDRGSALRSSVGKKVLMGVSGLFLLAFVVLHMLGNLKAFQGADSFNHYAEFLKDIGSPMLPHMGFLWVQRVVLLGLLILHVGLAINLARLSRAARPLRYKQNPDLGFSYASRTMRWGGIIIALFVVYHLLHMTVGNAHPDFIGGDAYHNLVAGFSVPWVVAIYVLAVTALCFHLYHGVWSVTQTFGFAGPRADSVSGTIAKVIALGLWAGYLVIPISVLMGWIAP